jgi:hypothetical protein
MNDMPATFSDKFKQALEDAKNQSKNFNDIQMPSSPAPSLQSGNPVFEQQQVENVTKNIMDAFMNSFQGNIDRISSARLNAQEFHSNMNGMGKNLHNAENQVNNVQENLRTNSYSALEQRNMSNAGLDAHKLQELQNGLGELVKNNSSFERQGIKLTNSTNNFEKAYSNFEKDPSAQNMKNVQDAAKIIDEQLKASAQTTNDMMQVMSKLSDITKMSTDKYDKLPDDVKKMLDYFKQIEESTQKSAKNLSGLDGDFPMSGGIGDTLTKGLKESNGELGKMSSLFGGLKKDAGSILSKFTGIMGTIGSIGSTMNALGLGVGIPTSVGDMKAYVKGTVDWYKKFGQMDVTSAQAQMAAGAGGVDNSILTDNRKTGMDLQLKTFGIVDYNDYANMSNSLISGVQGHYGNGANKADGIGDMQSMSKSALLLNKAYGVD